MHIEASVVQRAIPMTFYVSNEIADLIKTAAEKETLSTSAFVRRAAVSSAQKAMTERAS